MTRSSAEQAKFRKAVFHAHKQHDENGRVYLVCGRCGSKIDPVYGWEADHTIPREFGGTEGQPLCKPCHKRKTATKDIPAIAKSKRASDKHYGIKRKGWGGNQRKKMNGDVVPK
ncbi:MAG: HNH endonuclease [Proteobacteria bacterium]|nr:HNH endonuclease [Pseudomonadota bacterium]